MSASPSKGAVKNQANLASRVAVQYRRQVQRLFEAVVALLSTNKLGGGLKSVLALPVVTTAKPEAKDQQKYHG